MKKTTSTGVTNPLRGLTTVVYHAMDHAAAKQWYTELLGVPPYLGRPGYAEFRIGDYQHELGLLNTKYLAELGGQAPPAASGPSGVILYWHVDDVEATLARLQQMGATLHQPPRDFGRGFIGASVIDPFGNILGIMYNPHYLEMLGRAQAAA
jgi:predicted enzyme related to lactoylglutathione lyase